jgi:hypothetical protein
MESKLKLLAGAVAICMPMAATAQDAPKSEEPAQQAAPQATEQQSNTPAPESQVKPATAADIKKGATVHDQKGDLVGKVESVDAEGVVVATDTTRAKIALSGIGVGEKGLVVGITRAELEAEAKKAKPEAKKEKPEAKEEKPEAPQ